MIESNVDNGIFVLKMTSGENRFNSTHLDALDAALDQAERTPSLRALVTIGEGKFYSNGLDLDWMKEAGAEQTAVCVARVHSLFGRILAFPAITVAALNGHAVAAGAMFALAHDFRVMRSDRGYFYLPEVTIGMPFTLAMDALIRSKLPTVTAHEAMVTARRYTAQDALTAQIVHQTASQEQLVASAVGLANTHGGKHAATIGAIKKTMYSQVFQAIDAANRLLSQ